jgi:hypothetical protein
MFEMSERNALGRSLLVAGILSGILLGASVIATGAQADIETVSLCSPDFRTTSRLLSQEHACLWM